jgi:thymidine phosphorylase
MVAAQGGDPAAPLPEATARHEVRAEEDGVLQRLDARAVGVAAWRLGAGRARKEDPVSATAGVVCHAKPGDTVRRGDVLLELHHDGDGRLDDALAALAGAVVVGSEAPAATPLVADRTA